MEIKLDIYSEVYTISSELHHMLCKVANQCIMLEGLNDRFCAYIEIVDDEKIHALNKATRGVDRPTDVLSYPSVQFKNGTAKDNRKLLEREFDPDEGAIMLGSIIISLDRVKDQSEEYGHSYERELGYLTAHSMFHLMGYDHEMQEKKIIMRRLEEQAMANIGLFREET